MDLAPDRRRGARCAPRCAPGCASTCRGSTARACRRASTTSPRRSRSAASGRRSWPAAAGSASRGPRSTAAAAPAPVEHYIVTEELARARAPELVGRIGINLVGPDAARARHARAEGALAAATSSRPSELWCQLFSEPGAGSDLASVGDAARRAPTAAGCSTARRCGRATRSSPTGASASPAPTPTCRSSEGISYLVVDMRAPGVEVRPLRQITDESEFNEVFFADVFVPDDQLIGPENEGWRVANSTLTHERGINPRQLVIHVQLLEELLRLALEPGAFDDHRLAPAARAGRPSRCGCSSCTTGASLSRARQGRGARARGQRRSSSTGAR